MKKQSITIQETEHVVDDHFFDVVGNEFKDHVKGLAEWLKNSADAYIDKGTPSAEQYIVLRLTDEGTPLPMIECIDFVGMSQVNIDKAFKRWGDPTAAKRGKNIKVYGGHGNGGKFYMRQAFAESRFITYKDGLLNVFGFSKNKKYGYAKGYENKRISPVDAMKFAELTALPIPESTKEKILKQQTGFTVVLGIDPVGIRKKIKPTKEMEKLKNFPQSRRVLGQTNVSVVYNNASLYGLLKPDTLTPLEKFEIPRVVNIPASIEIQSGREKILVLLASEKYEQGQLVLKTSAEPLARGGKLGELNRIDVLGEIGVLATYQLYELGVRGFPQAAFIYGEFQLPILENPEYDCVSNDRVKLIKNETTEALIQWVSTEVDKLASEIGAVEREKQKESQKEISSKFNDVLNQWKNQHMKKIMSEIFNATGTGGGEGAGGFVGTEVTLPKNGFDFKFPEMEVPHNTPTRATLKVTVPDALPIGASIFLALDNEHILIDQSKITIKSDFLKVTNQGKEVAFINIDVTGMEVGVEATLTASAGKLSATTKIKTIAKKDSGSGGGFPRVLLSGHDTDPLGIAPEGKVYLSERESVVYQRPQDLAESIYWINTASPMASEIHSRFTFESIQWRNFLFERYVDIFVKETIHELEKKDYENFNADTIDNKIAETISKVHASAKKDLDRFLFDTSYTVDKKDERLI